MSKRLLESDFLTVNIASIINKSKLKDNAEDEIAATDEKDDKKKAGTGAGKAKPADFDWGAELKSRIEANKKMSAESRIDQHVLEKKFFTEYFHANWDDECAKQLLSIGYDLWKVLKEGGFNKRVNPILGFISMKYVQDALIRTKLLGINTFKAIRDAVVNKYVADSEFMAYRDYNIIYCQDLYRKSKDDMLEYLKAQKNILKPELSSYSVKLQEHNKKAFFNLQKFNKEPDIAKRAKAIKNSEGLKLPVAKNPNTLLNSLALVTAISGIRVGGEGEEARSHMTSEKQQKLISKLDTPAKKLAALVALSVSTGNESAKKAIANGVIENVSTDKLLAASIAISAFMPKGHLDQKDADMLVAGIVGQG
jgi:hypothetical protein